MVYSCQELLSELNDIFKKETIKYPDMLNSRNSAYRVISETMKEFILKFKNQQTIPTDGIDLWKTILYSVEKDKDGEVQKAARKLLGLDRDRYAEVHGVTKQKEKRKQSYGQIQACSG